MLLSRIAYFFRAFNPFSRIKNFSLPFRIIIILHPLFSLAYMQFLYLFIYDYVPVLLFE